MNAAEFSVNGLILAAVALSAHARSVVAVERPWNAPPDAEAIEPLTSPRPLAPEPTPFTVEPGRLAVEAFLLDFAYDRHNPERANERVYAFEWPLLFRYGVTHDLELQFGIETFAHETVYDRDARTRESADGFGDLILGAKYNLWGNDDGPSALAVLPQLRLPTNRHGLGNRGVEGGVFLPYAMALPLEFELEWTPGFSAARNSADDGYTFEWFSQLSLAREVADDLEWYIEFQTSITAERGEPWEGIINTALIWHITEDALLEIGTGWGVTRSADDFNLFLTLVHRF